MRQQIQLITPAIAESYLELNSGNRKVNEGHVINLAGAMSRGEWVVNGDSIRFTASSRLVDGQHRLAAIVKSGVTLNMVVVTGLSDDAFMTIDCGKSRGISDTFSIKGYKNAAVLSGMVKLMHHYTERGAPYSSNGRNTPTSAQCLAVIDTYPGLAESANYTARRNLRGLLGAQTLGFCHFVFGLKSSDDRDEFFDELENGCYSYKHSPIHALRNTLTENLINKKKMPVYMKTAYVFTAFNKFRHRAETKRLSLPRNKLAWYLVV